MFNTRFVSRGTVYAALLAGTTLAGFAAGHAVLATPSDGAAIAAPIQPAAPSQRLADFSGLVTQVKPAVLSITTELSAEAIAEEDDGASRPMPMQPHGRQHAEARGSGFLIDADGTIVTNNHVVKGAKSVSVTLDDGTQLPARVLGRDARTDLAVLKVDAGRKLPFIQLGDSDKVRVGEWVVAMGNPFGLGGTVTAGILSASGRDIGSGPYDNFLQIDAPINRGNSGGPLFTQDGQVVGVNSAIVSPSGGSIGIGFAIPSNMVKTVVAELEKNGHVTRGYLGVSAQPVTPAIAAALGGKAEAGALVANVEPDSPAAKADVKPGDIIVSVDGKAVKSPRDLAVDVAAVMPGETAKIAVLRNGETQTLTATVAALPGEATADAGPAASAPRKGIGLALAPLTPEARNQLDVPERTKGAVVADVKQGSPAEMAGIQQGDVILGVGQASVSSPDQAAHAIKDAIKGGKSVALRVLREGHTTFVAVDPSKSEQNEG